MKKKLLAIISLLVALVMCFTLAACGPNSTNNNNSGYDPSDDPDYDPDDDPDDGTIIEAKRLFEKLSTAVNAFYSNEGYTVTIDASEKSKSTGPNGYNEIFERAGDWIVIGSGEEGKESYYSINTGYTYSPAYVYDSGSEEFVGYGFDTSLPLGFADYFTEVITNIMQSGATATSAVAITIPEFVDITYNEDTLTATVKIDLAETVNAFTAPLRTNYANGSLADVINDYLEMVAPGLTLDTVIETINGFAIDNKNATVGQLADTIGAAVGTDNLSGQLESMLSDYGFEQANITAIMNRTLAEMVMGAMQAMTSGFPPETPREEKINAILNAAFFEEVDIEGYELTIEQFATAITTLLKGTDFKNTIDSTTEFGAIIADNVEFTDLSAEFTVTFDAQERITAMTLDVGIAHNADERNYDNTSFFADNDYAANVEIAIFDYVASVEFEPEIEFSSGLAMTDYVMVVAQSGKDVSAYIELGGAEAVNTDEIIVGGSSASGTEYLTPEAGEVVFDKTTSMLTVKSSLFENTELTNIFVYIEALRNDVPAYMGIYFIEVPAAETATLTDLVEFFSNMM